MLQAFLNLATDTMRLVLQREYLPALTLRLSQRFQTYIRQVLDFRTEPTSLAGAIRSVSTSLAANKCILILAKYSTIPLVSQVIGITAQRYE